MRKRQTFKQKQKTVGKRQKTLKANATNAELVMKAKLDQIGVRAIFQKGFIEGPNYVIVDFYIPKKKLCIEVDGGYHNTPKQQLRDTNRTHYLEKYRGFKVLRITNEDAFEISLDDLGNLIKSV